MNFLDLNVLDIIGTISGFVFTIMIFSYIFGDNPLFRFATHVFIGVSAGYVVIITIYNVILPQMIYPFLQGTSSILTILIWVGAFFMVFKAFPNLAKIGNGVMAYIVGVGVAVAIGGSVLGTILPQASGTIQLFDNSTFQSAETPSWLNFVNALFILIGTLSTLIYFQFYTSGNARNTLSRWFQKIALVKNIGRIYIAITFGALFVGVYIASVTAFVERFAFIRDILLNLFSPFLGS
ncbi:MAG: hypothetical protein J7L73_02515 [Anaerolineales bacterium]|nr:hypothetical protein [Anaerolineales bacterium]